MRTVYLDIDSGDKANFCRLLAASIRAGSPILVALSIAGGCASNPRMKKASDAMAAHIREGHMLITQDWLKNYPEFADGFFESYVECGMDAGELETCLCILADRYDRARRISPTCLLTQSEPLAIFTESFADLVTVGCPILRALHTCQTMLINRHFPIMGNAVEAIIAEIDQGSLISEAMEKRRETFPAEYIALFRNAEKSESIEGILKMTLRRD